MTTLGCMSMRVTVFLLLPTIQRGHRLFIISYMFILGKIRLLPTEKQVEILEEVDLMLMRKVMKSNVKTAKESFYLESGCLPIRFVIAKRRLMFLWNILKRDKKEMIRKVYEAQKGIEG